MNSAFYLRGKIITNRYEILKHYLKGDFIADVLLTSLNFYDEYLFPHFSLFLILRVYRLSNIVSNLEIILNLRDRFS